MRIAIETHFTQWQRGNLSAESMAAQFKILAVGERQFSELQEPREWFKFLRSQGYSPEDMLLQMKHYKWRFFDLYCSVYNDYKEAEHEEALRNQGIYI